MPIGAHFELHIEQGPLLESSGRKVGVVCTDLLFFEPQVDLTSDYLNCFVYDQQKETLDWIYYFWSGIKLSTDTHVESLASRCFEFSVVD
jgi:hypothetical protein